MDIYQQMAGQAQALLPWMVERRRDFHKYAETGWFEVRTTSIIANRLTELGYEVITGRNVCLAEARMGLPNADALKQQYLRALSQGAIEPFAQQAKDGFTGAIGILRCGEGPVIAMRFDIDALGVYESKDSAHRPTLEGFSSVNEGMMHACGHDGHATIGLAVAEILMKHKASLKGTVKLIFQPAEEGVRGASAITAHGHVDDVDFFIANHMGDRGNKPYQIGISTGTTLATSKLDITITGKAAHAGVCPEKGSNALLAAATAVLNLHAIPRSSQGDTRVNVGSLKAGSGRNVVPDQAKMEVEVRGSTTEANNYVEAYARRIAESAAAMHGCGCSIALVGAAEAMHSDPEMLELCTRVCTQKLGITVSPPVPEAGASEDCAYFMNRVRNHGGKGLFFNTLTPCAGQFHSKLFDFDEAALPTAVTAFCGLSLYLMGIE